MKLYIALVLVVLMGAIGNVQGFPSQLKDSQDMKIWPIPQPTEEEASQEIKRNIKSDRIRFFLYTQNNPRTPFEIKTKDLESLKDSPFDSKNPTRIMIHGFNGYYLGEENTVIRKALLENGETREFNFISVDWTVYSETKNYISAKNKCSKTGQFVAEFIDWMHISANLSFDSLALYGHSLGAHIAGFAGKNLQHGIIDTIIGLDPALPLFSSKNPENRLSDTDARYVETIHTNGGLLGFYNPIGKTSFYPNGGKVQPGCENDVTGVCSHIRSAYYLAEALRFPHKNRLQGIGCRDFESLKSNNCNQYGMRSRLGDPHNAETSSGIFYLETNSESPFGIYTNV